MEQLLLFPITECQHEGDINLVPVDPNFPLLIVYDGLLECRECGKLFYRNQWIKGE